MTSFMFTGIFSIIVSQIVVYRSKIFKLFTNRSISFSVITVF